MSLGTAASGAPLPDWALTSVPEGEPEFVRARRESAVAELRSRGLPTRKTEAFRVTPVRALLETDYAPTTLDADADSAAVLRKLGHDGTYRTIVTDGRLEMEGSTRDGVRIATLDELLPSHGERIERALGRLVPGEHFVAANAASFREAIVVLVPDGVRSTVPVHLAHVVATRGTPTVVNPRILVLLGEGSALTLVETYLGDGPGTAFCNSVVELALAPGSSLDHVLSLESVGATLVSVGVEIEAGATYRARAALLGGKLARIDHHVTLAGESAHADLSGVLLARGEDLVDHHVRVDHRAPRGTSVQRFRGLADERGTSIFDGIVVVRPSAPGCEVAQESKNLLLSAGACVHAKPHLEIEIDEVVASHGTTVGSFDRDQLFYLRARGIDESVAKAMLTHAFVRSVLDDVPVDSVRTRLERALLARLPEGASVLDEEQA